jgi:hypothetical protein
MWWCCGRRNKDDPGCKYAKHDNRDDAGGLDGGGGNVAGEAIFDLDEDNANM